MLGTFKIDKSNFGHALEAFIISIVITAVCVGATWLGWLAYTPAEGFLLGSGLALAWYIGREKRDCETGLKLKAGSPMAWLLMWRRWKNVLDLAGPFVVFLISLGIYHGR